MCSLFDEDATTRVAVAHTHSLLQETFIKWDENRRRRSSSSPSTTSSACTIRIGLDQAKRFDCAAAAAAAGAAPPPFLFFAFAVPIRARELGDVLTTSTAN